MLEIQQTAPGRWLAATAPGRLAVVECEKPSSEYVAELWRGIANGNGVQATLDHLTRNGLSVTPAFVLLEWDAAAEGSSAAIGRLRCIVRGTIRLRVDTATARRTLGAEGVSTWLEQLVDDVTGFSVDADDSASVPTDGDAALLPLSSGAAWVNMVQTAAFERAETPAVAAVPEPEPEPELAPVHAPEPEPEPVETVDDATMMRNAEPEPEPAAAPAPAPIAPPDYVTETISNTVVPDDGDHDGMTVFSGDIRKMREAQHEVAAEQTRAPVPEHHDEPAQFVVNITGGTSETLGELTLVGRAPSVSKVSGGRVPKLITVGSADQDISRNHVQLAVEGDTVVVTDLHSRNGTMIVLPGKSPQKLRQGEPTSVIVGTLVDLGGGVTMTVGQE